MENHNSINTSGLLTILGQGYDASLPSTVLSAVSELKLTALTELQLAGWFNQTNNHTKLYEELLKCDGKWFEFQTLGKLLERASEIVRELPKDKRTQLEALFVETVHGSEGERRIGTILQTLSGGIPLTRQVTLDFFKK